MGMVGGEQGGMHIKLATAGPTEGRFAGKAEGYVCELPGNYPLKTTYGSLPFLLVNYS